MKRDLSNQNVGGKAVFSFLSNQRGYSCQQEVSCNARRKATDVFMKEKKIHLRLFPMRFDFVSVRFELFLAKPEDVLRLQKRRGRSRTFRNESTYSIMLSDRCPDARNDRGINTFNNTINSIISLLGMFFF